MQEVEAAKWLIVAWVKGWHMRNLARTILGRDFKDEDAQELNSAFKFLSADPYKYVIHGRGLDVRRFVADYLPGINNRMWDAKTDADRMALAPAIAKMKCVKKIVCSREAIETAKARKEAKANTMGMYAYGEHRRKCNRSAWSTCK